MPPRGANQRSPERHRHSGDLVTYKTKRGITVTQLKGGSKGHTATDAEWWKRVEFAFVTRLIKYAIDIEANAARELSKGTLMFPRDILAMAAYGTLLDVRTVDGRHLQGVRLVTKDVQAMLNVISQAPGAMLYRGIDDWIAIIPGPVGAIMMSDEATGFPKWSNGSLSDEVLQASLDGMSSDVGALIVRGQSGWSAISPGTAGEYLMSHGAGHVPEWVPGSGGSGGQGITPPTIVQQATTRIPFYAQQNIVFENDLTPGNVVLLIGVGFQDQANAAISGFSLMANWGGGYQGYRVQARVVQSGDAKTIVTPATGKSVHNWLALELSGVSNIVVTHQDFSTTSTTMTTASQRALGAVTIQVHEIDGVQYCTDMAGASVMFAPAADTSNHKVAYGNVESLAFLHQVTTTWSSDGLAYPLAIKVDILGT